MGLKSWDGESDVASLCSTLKLLITDQVGGLSFICIRCLLLCAMWMTGSFAYGRLSCRCSSTCLFSKDQAADLYLSKCLPLIWIVYNIVQSPASLVQEDRRAAVILQWEGRGDHLPHKLKRANETAQSHLTYSRMFHKDHRGGCFLWIFGWMAVQKCFADNKVHSQTVWEHLASL